MNFYFVFQNATYSLESAGGYVWAPAHQNGRNVHHHQRVNDLRTGDRIVHCAGGYIRAFSHVVSNPAIEQRPAGGHDEWDNEGYRVSTSYFELQVPIHVQQFMDNILPLQVNKHAPFNVRKRGNEGYMFICGEQLFSYLLDLSASLQTNLQLRADLLSTFSIQARVELEVDQKEMEYINESQIPPEPKPYTPEPKPIPQAIPTPAGVTYARDRGAALNALARAGHRCEINPDHRSFIRKGSNLPYVEPHHLIPMSAQGSFTNSLDVEANIVALCSNCHNEIHYGSSYLQILKTLYLERKIILERAGLEVSFEEIARFYE